MSQGQRISFLGGGNMATALIKGLLAARTTSPSNITVSDVRPEALAALARAHGVATTPSNVLAASADILVLSVKPQVFPELLAELAGHVASSTLVISIAAGVPLAAIEGRLAKDTRVIRAMPNTPALVGAGATALAAGAHASDADLQAAEAVFRSVGVTVRVPESAMDAVTALSGSGPAYLFLLAEALAEAGEHAGLPRETAATLARQTVVGAARLLGDSSLSPSELRRNVTSPGGTTQAAIETLERHGIRGALQQAVLAARERGAQLGREAAEKLAR